MSTIYNFSELSVEELKQFADSLVEKINSGSLFSDEVDFKIDEIEADEMSGNLLIIASHDDYIQVARGATWTCSDTSEINRRPDDPDFDESIFDAAKNNFKATEIEIDGYKVSLSIEDIDVGEILDVEADSYSHEDDGIGDYDYFGFRGYDSRPYINVEGTLVNGCSCSISLIVEPLE